jgi:hypothetical protein
LIPTILLPALVIGRWWFPPIAAVAWPLFLSATDVCTGFCMLEAAALAAANAVVAVLIHKGFRRILHRDSAET